MEALVLLFHHPLQLTPVGACDNTPPIVTLPPTSLLKEEISNNLGKGPVSLTVAEDVSLVLT